MTDEEIDKLFKSELSGQKAPVHESDWTAFEGMLDSGQSGISKWVVLVAFLILLGGGAIAYYFMPEPELRYAKRSETHSAASNENDLSDAEDFKEENMRSDSGNSLSGEELAQEGDKETSGASMPSTVEESESIVSQKGEKTSRADLSSVDPPSKREQTYETSNSIRALEMESGENSGPSADVQSTRQAANTEESYFANEVANSFSKTNSNANSTRALNEENTLNASSARGALKLMNPKGVEAFDAITPKIDGNKRSIETARRRPFRPFLYFKLEQNNVLKTTPALGLGWERRIPLKGDGALSLRGGIGYQRTGRLTWEKSSQNVVYGFDRYVEEVSLRTNNIGMIQVPLRVGYHIGIHSVFAGAELNWVATASQEYQAAAEGQVENGYLYKTGVPETAVFY